MLHLEKMSVGVLLPPPAPSSVFLQRDIMDGASASLGMLTAVGAMGEAPTQSLTLNKMLKIPLLIALGLH